MRQESPFGSADLAELDMLMLDRAERVIAMEDVHDGDHHPAAIALRHDVDATTSTTRHALRTAEKIAEWEAQRGYRATYYFLHTAPYWRRPGFRETLDRISEYGHEIGIHTDALAEALRTGADPDDILYDAIEELRGYGFKIRGVAGHGNPICNRNRGPGEITFANDEQFVECARPKEGPPDRIISRGNISLRLAPRKLEEFGLDYEALMLAHGKGMRPFRISDSGGRWLNPGWEETVEKWNRDRRENPYLSRPTAEVHQLHFLWHPDWWSEAFVPQAAAA